MISILLTGVLPIFAIAAIGYAMGKRGIFDIAAASAINKMVFLVAVPSLGLRLIINAPFAEFDWLLLIGFFVSEVAVYLIGFLVCWKILRCEFKESILLGLAASFGNHILFVLPIAVTLFGEEQTLPIVAIIALDTIFIFGGTILLMESLSSKSVSIGGFLSKIFQNPPLVSMLLGIAVVVISLDIPEGINTFLKFVGNIAAPCALFSLGIVLSQTRSTDRLPASLSMCGLKLVGHPIIAGAVLLGYFSFPMDVAKTSMMVAAAPCGAMAFVLAMNYKVRTDAIAPAILFSTVGSLLSVTLAAAL